MVYNEIIASSGIFTIFRNPVVRTPLERLWFVDRTEIMPIRVDIGDKVDVQNFSSIGSREVGQFSV